METFADQAVIAIENVRLFNEIQDKSRQLQLASENKSQFVSSNLGGRSPAVGADLASTLRQV